jgi:CRP/FNR family cyclic AMP-dependent transcriptional regulator
MTHLPMLRYADIFYEMRTEHLERVEAICIEIVLDEGAIVLKENTRGDDMYIVASGEVEIQVDPGMLGIEAETKPTTIATLRKGQVFGEVVLVDQGLRSASARVGVDGTRLLQIKRDDLIALCEADFEFGYLLMRNIAADMAFKIRGADLMVREHLVWEANRSVDPSC